jgi:hypothetical protein
VSLLYLKAEGIFISSTARHDHSKRLILKVVYSFSVVGFVFMPVVSFWLFPSHFICGLSGMFCKKFRFVVRDVDFPVILMSAEFNPA